MKSCSKFGGASFVWIWMDFGTSVYVYMYIVLVVATKSSLRLDAWDFQQGNGDSTSTLSLREPRLSPSSSALDRFRI